MPGTEEWMDLLKKLRHSLPPPTLHHLETPACSSSSFLQSEWRKKKLDTVHTAGISLTTTSIQELARLYQDWFTNPHQVALGLLLSLSMRNFFGFLYWSIIFLNVLIIFSLLYCKVWASCCILNKKTQDGKWSTVGTVKLDTLTPILAHNHKFNNYIQLMQRRLHQYL